MKLKFVVANLSEVPEQFRELYTAGSDGMFYLNADGAVSKDKLDEFRNNNVDLLKKLDAFKGIDPAKIQEMLDNERKIAEKKLIDAGDIEGLVAQRVATMKQEYDGQINQLKEQLGTSNRQLETLIIDNSVREQAVKLGVAATAVDDVLLRAKTVFKVENGAAVAKDSKGQTIYGKDGQTSLGIGDWIGGLKEQAPHLFQPSQGSGARTTGPNAGGNPNMSPAQKIAAGLASGNSVAIQN